MPPSAHWNVTPDRAPRRWPATWPRATRLDGAASQDMAPRLPTTYSEDQCAWPDRQHTAYLSLGNDEELNLMPGVSA